MEAKWYHYGTMGIGSISDITSYLAKVWIHLAIENCCETKQLLRSEPKIGGRIFQESIFSAEDVGIVPMGRFMKLLEWWWRVYLTSFLSMESMDGVLQCFVHVECSKNVVLLIFWIHFWKRFDGDLRWIPLTKNRCYSCPKYCATLQDIQRQLPTESAKFKTVDKLGDLSWRRWSEMFLTSCFSRWLGASETLVMLRHWWNKNIESITGLSESGDKLTKKIGWFGWWLMVWIEVHKEETRQRFNGCFWFP